MLPLWTPHRHSSFAAFILLLGLSVGAPSEAALTKPDVEIDPILPSIPLPVAIPSLSGSRFSSSVELRWSIDCSVTAVNIQESINNQSWTTIYTGLGQADNTAAYATFAVGGDVCSGDWSSKRLLQLPNKTLPGYYYRINACKGSLCSAYSPSILVGTPSAPSTPSAPASISTPATNTTGAFSVSWAGVSGATRYELQQRINGGVWVAKYSGTATSYALSGLASGTYQYQARACSTACSAWKLSSNTQVSLPVLGSDWKNLSRVTVADAGGSDIEPAEVVDLNAAAVKGQAGVSGGQASYHIPIDLPPGRNGVQPSISLSYNSQGGNGILGVGWSLNAGSSISRCGATFAQDGFTRAVTFNASTDRLCLDGQRLIVASGSYGASNAEYRTEMDSFVKVVQHGNINDSNSSFTVYKPDGSRATYGANANSRFVPSGLSTALSWKVTQESYSNGANTIDYQYDTSVAGEHLLSQILYTGSLGALGDRNITFYYQPRTDKRKSYLAGGLTTSTRLLSELKVNGAGGQSVHQYQFDYQLSPASGRHLLRALAQCDALGHCTPQTQLTWRDSASTVKADELLIGGQAVFSGELDINKVTPHGDANGDGSTDFPGYDSNAEQDMLGQNGFTHEKACYNDYVSDGWICVAFDADHDGKVDPFKSINNILHIQLSASGAASYVSTGIPFNPNRFPSPDRLMSATDLNGDGDVDLMVFTVVSGKGYWRAYLNTGNASTPYSANSFQLIHETAIDPKLGSWPARPEVDVTMAGDIDGNGMVDFVVSSLGGSGAANAPVPVLRSFILNNSTPQQWSVQWSSAPTYPFHTGDGFHFFQKLIDINGDELADIISWRMVNNDRVIGYELNQGRATFAPWVAFAGNLHLKERFHSVVVTAQEPMDVIYPQYFDSMQTADIDLDGIEEILLPGQRVITGCAYVMFPGGTSGSGIKRTLCGDALYGDLPVNSFNTVPSKPITSSDFDDSIYQYDAIKFVLQVDGRWGLVKQSTPYYGSAHESRLVDTFGDGLVDMLTTYGPRVPGTGQFNETWIQNPGSSMWGTRYGAYLSRNYGSGNGQTTNDYAATDYLQAVTDGLGNRSEWRYRPLSTGEGSADQAKLYTTDHNEVGSGYVHFASSMYVVQSFKQSNGQSGENETQYAYKGAMYNLQGRGFTGFNQIWEKDMQRDKTVHSVFKQKFPEVGLLMSQTVVAPNKNGVKGTVVELKNTWVDNPQHKASLVRSKGVHHNIQTSSLQKSWDLDDGSLMSEIKQTVGTSPTDVDEWGNIKKQTQKVTDYIKGQANTYTSVTETGFVPDVNNWWLNKFNWIKTSHNTAQRNWGDDPVGTMDKAQWQLQTVNTWDSNHKLPTKVTYTGSNSSCNRVEETELNSYGLPRWTKTTGQSSTCSAMTARQTSFTYTKDGTTQVDDGYLPYKVINAKGHITTTEYDMGLGLPTKVIAPNNIVTQTEYDGIGRPVQVKQTGSPTRYLRYLLANEGNNPPQDNDNIPVMMTRTSGAGMPETEQYFDGQGRLLRTATQGFDGGYQYQDKHYDALGRLTRESTPYGNGTAADYTEFSNFDALDRPGRRTIPNGRSGGLESLYSYNGLTTDINVEGRLMSRTYGSQGWLYETVDAQNGTNRFAYDSAGRPLVIRDANNCDIKATYNGFGHKTQVIDPNQGTTNFGYNSVGELDKQTDANGVVQTYVLDVLGRVTSKTTTGGSAPGTATFVWDTPKQGLLTSETENGVARTYAYTTALQLAQTTVTVDGVSRTVKHQYDGFYGRPKALEYPNGLTLKYAYNDYGYLEQTSNAASGYLYRQVTAMDEAGHTTGADLANRVMSESRSYYSEGTMASVAVDGPLGRIHAHYYDGYDDFMNLTSERDGVTGLTKSYRYDTLNRLTEYQFSNTNPTFSATVNYGYDKVGNFLKKTDYSANSSTAYRYGGSACGYKPNAVCQLDKLNGTTVSFQYDNRGNLRVGDGLTMTYNAMDKPLSVSGRGATTSFVYGSDNMRAKQSRTVGSATTTTYYVDKYYEADSDGSWRAYLDDIAVLSYTSQRGHLLQFTLKDRLGSATTLADQNGNIVSQRYFDPFGRTASTGGGHRTDIVNKNTLQSKLQDLDITNKNRRGFTDHEHLNEQQLIHMNGRIYDYNLGRFMSVDPLIQSPTSTQSVNPYSYIMNNPLAGTDPTGYAADYIAGVSFGYNAGLTTTQLELLNNAESCSYCTGEFAAGVNLGSDFKSAKREAGSLFAGALFLAKAKLPALPNSGADSSIKTETGEAADIGSKPDSRVDSRPKFWASTNNDAVEESKDQDGVMRCSKCDTGLTGERQSNGKRDYQLGHPEDSPWVEQQDEWREKSKNGEDFTRRDVTEKYQEGVKVECVGCNASHGGRLGNQRKSGSSGRGQSTGIKVVRVTGRLDSMKLDKLEKK
uniref:YD repeat protein n=2 Tax=Shewanella TaxID=22 RepID=Q0HXN2_SHESR